MFDRSFLKPARLEIAVVADTHYFVTPDDRPVEFASRLRQSARAGHALRLAAALRADCTVHLGDVAQAVPDGPDFMATVAAAQRQIAACGLAPYHVAGNQDIGDKPDPTMPTGWVTPATLTAYHDRFGPSWYAFPADDHHAIVLNSQIMNTTLPEAETQRRWLEQELASHAAQPIILFTHLPLFLTDEHEPDLGHYDNLGQPARAWLLDLVRRYRVVLVLTGHSHWSFVNRIGATRLYVSPSTSHTRPGFSELFSSAPPAEQGRDDAAKLGLTLIRLQADGLRRHVIRTGGATEPPDPADGALILTRLSADLPGSPLGVTLTHPLAPRAEVPLAWPSVIRQPVRNDYPLLACVELGVRAVRVPGTDLDQPLQVDRLALLRDEGVALIGIWLWSATLDLPGLMERHADLLDGVELQLPGALLPDSATIAAIAASQAIAGRPITLAPILPGQPVPGKQLQRTRVGYRLDELSRLNDRLADVGLSLARALVRLDATTPGWWTPIMPGPLDRPSPPPTLPALSHIQALDWVIDAATMDEGTQTARLLAALFTLSTPSRSRLFIEPLIDLDRTMDVSLGLLDRQCNPRPAFHALRCLNTALFADPAASATWSLTLPPTRPAPTSHWIDLLTTRRAAPNQSPPPDHPILSARTERLGERSSHEPTS